MPHETEFAEIREAEDDINLLVGLQPHIKNPNIKAMMREYIDRASDVHNFMLEDYYNSFETARMERSKVKNSTNDRMALTAIQVRLMELRNLTRGTIYAGRIQQLMNDVAEYKGRSHNENIA